MSLPADSIARLRLIRTESIGPITYRQLVARFGSAAAALDALPDLAQRGNRKLNIPPPEVAEAELAAAQAMGAALLFLGTPDYPALLARTETAPPVLYARGQRDLLERPAVAIVGARNASAAGTRFARQLASDLAGADQVVVSGLARGIDAAAHVAALDGGTIAVVAGGADVAYPPDHAELTQRIADAGLIIAEQPAGTQPQARHFPRRNRIIAGLSAGTIVVEGALKSGSLITARIAADLGREVMAVPGSPLDPRAQGCNQLIREGATLIQSAADVLEALSTLSGQPSLPLQVAEPLPAPLLTAEPQARAAITALLSPTPVLIDELVRQSGLPAAQVATVLLDLELEGAIVRHAGGRAALA
ncbi:MAG: DNA-processing protein DprA [Sphingomonadales bacterium]|jgi:DNA processing protein